MSKPIYILALWNVRTGGPEATHQLSDALIEQGFDARMVYFDWGQIAALERSGDDEAYNFGLRLNPIEEYARYKTNVVASVPHQEGVVVVLPETLCHLAPWFSRATVLIWWLSVDNAFGALSKVNLNHLRKPSVRHAWQSDYARSVIDALHLPNCGPLSDYTVDLTQYASIKSWSDRVPLILFNGNHKVATSLQPIFDEIANLNPSFSCQRLSGMPRQSVAELFSCAMAYVDLGTFPGKDRLPREAASMGCIPIVSAIGAGSEVGGVTLDPDLGISPIAHSIVRAIESNAPFAPSVALLAERDHFFDQAQDIFSFDEL